MIRKLETELELELAKRRSELAFTVRGRVVEFEESITAPVIYAPLLAFVLVDGLVTTYQAICFPIYGIPRVHRRDYLIFDRYQLAYLNAIERINCLYCSYANGLLAYVREIASRTEQYWCPIKHARRVIAAHEHYARFVDYGDAENYHRELAQLRQQLREQLEPKE
jgi:hypothetical protein